MGRAAGLAWRWLDFLRGCGGSSGRGGRIIGRIRLIQQQWHDAHILVGPYLAGRYYTIGAGEVLMDDDNSTAAIEDQLIGASTYPASRLVGQGDACLCMALHGS